jgi:UDP-glucose 4-epimerase
MKVLVTGGAGFIGSHMAERLVGDGHQVVVLDNEATGRRDNVPAGVLYVKGDVAHLDDLERAFAGGLDAVFHIAGQVSLIRSFTDPVMDLRTNVEGTVNVVQLCVRHHVSRLLYASSMQVHGVTNVVPTPEATPCRPALLNNRRRAGRRCVPSVALAYRG